MFKRRDKLYKKYIKAKGNVIKDDYHKRYKELRNQILTLCRQSKNLYYQKYFTENTKDIKSTWKGIKSIININSRSKITPTSLIVDNKVNTDPIVIANKFNHYFSSIASNLQGQIYHKEQDFTHLKNRNSTNFFVNPTDKYEIIDIINSLSKNKA